MSSLSSLKSRLELPSTRVVALIGGVVVLFSVALGKGAKVGA